MLLIVRFFPEIILKSKPVRQQMVRRLEQTVRARLRPLAPSLNVQRHWDHLVVTTEPGDAAGDQAVIDTLQRVSGIAHFMEVEHHPLDDLDDIARLAVDCWSERVRGRSIAVRCKRSGRHDFTSQQVERHVGAALLRHTEAAGVDLSHPEELLRIEIRDRELSLVTRRFQGIGGYPQGSQEAVLSLISGGYDSTVASYLSLRRGLTTHFVFFNLGGRDHELGVRQVSHYLWQQFAREQELQFISVPFEAVVAEILRSVHHSQMGVVLKRMMLRAASRLAPQVDARALVTGESVAQVSSQTLTNLAIIDAVTDQLVLRPLVTSHKGEIIALAQAIGTAPFAAAMPEYCGVISVKPTTRARAERIAAEEEAFDFSVLEAAIARAEQQPVRTVMDTLAAAAEVETLSAPVPDAEIIDIRHPLEAEARPLRLANAPVRRIPFYELPSRAHELDPERLYLLYCERGSMSRLHASHLMDSGFRRVKVYQPS